MTKKHIIKNSIKLIEMFAKELNLNISNKGDGHAFENTFWNGLFIDDSQIPEIKAYDDKETFLIELRSFWGNPEISIRNKIGYEEDLYVIHYSNGSHNENGDYIRTDDFKLYEIRIDTRENHKEKIDRRKRRRAAKKKVRAL